MFFVYYTFSFLTTKIVYFFQFRARSRALKEKNSRQQKKEGGQLAAFCNIGCQKGSVLADISINVQICGEVIDQIRNGDSITDEFDEVDYPRIL